MVVGRELKNSRIQEFRSSGVQEFRSSGVQEFRSREPGARSQRLWLAKLLNSEF
jgi:hypothetical protein